MAVEVQTEYICAMAVEWHLLVVPPDEFKAIVAAVPVNNWSQTDKAFLGLSLQSGEEFGGLLVLFIILGTVEGVGAKALGCESCMPVHTEEGIFISTLPKQLNALVVAVQVACFGANVPIASCVARREAMKEGFGLSVWRKGRGAELISASSRQITETASLGMKVNGCAVFSP